jgi:hypothetical protein
MAQNIFSEMETKGTHWKSFLFLAGTAALLAAMAALSDVLISIAVGNAVPEPGKGSVVDWFTLFQNNWFLGLYGLGLLNIVYTTFMIPIFIALFAIHQRTNQGFAALAITLFLIGAAMYFANNAALPMFTLSTRYTAASSEAQKSLILAAGQTLLAKAEDFSPGSFLPMLFMEMAEIIMMFVMLQGRLFSKATAWTGIAGFVALLIFIIWATYFPVFYSAALIFGISGGVLSMAWFIMVGRRLFQLGHNRL